MAISKQIIKQEMAIDPLALLLPNEIYVKLNLPRPQEIDEAKIKEHVEKLSVAERKVARDNVKALAAFAKTAGKVLESY